MRLEAVAPFGKPAFMLRRAARSATLVLPRDERVLRGAAPAAIVEALTGVALGPAELPGGRDRMRGWRCRARRGGRLYQERMGVDGLDGGATTVLAAADGEWRLGGRDARPAGGSTIPNSPWPRPARRHAPIAPAPGTGVGSDAAACRSSRSTSISTLRCSPCDVPEPDAGAADARRAAPQPVRSETDGQP